MSGLEAAGPVATVVRPGDGPAAGPLAAAAVRFEDWRGTDGVHALYLDLDLAERADLRRALAVPPGDARSDADLVLEAVERWGQGAPERLGGAFAFAVWDGRGQRVVAARDPVGLRPLVVAEPAGGVVLGGDVRAVTAAEGVPDTLDDDVMAATLLALRFYPTLVGRTCYRAVREVRPGHGLEADAGGTRDVRHWRPEDSPGLSIHRPGEVGEALRETLREVVLEAVADVPDGALGGHLSGGIDSTTVLAFAAEARAGAGLEAPVGFAWAPPPDGRPSAEHDRMASLAERWAIPVDWCPATAADHLAEMRMDAASDPTTMWAQEEPVRRAARARGVQVVLSGWGGDEGASFAGMGMATAELVRRGRWAPVAAQLLRDPADALRRARTWPARRPGARSEPSLEALREAALRGGHATFARPDLLRRADLLGLEPEPQPGDVAGTLAWLQGRGHLGARAGAWARAGAPLGVRYRFPLLDRRVLRLVHGLPVEAWLTRSRARRWPLRAAGAGVLPDPARLGGGKSEPRWRAASRAARVEARARAAALLGSGADPERAAYIDVPALHRALVAWADSDGPRPLTQEGLHAIAFVRF